MFLKHLKRNESYTRFLSGEARLAVLILGKIFLKNKLVALLVSHRWYRSASALSLDARGVKLLGTVPQDCLRSGCLPFTGTT